MLCEATADTVQQTQWLHWAVFLHFIFISSRTKSRGSTCTHQNNGITTLTYLTITEIGEMVTSSSLPHNSWTTKPQTANPGPGSHTITRPKAASQWDPPGVGWTAESLQPGLSWNVSK